MSAAKSYGWLMWSGGFLVGAAVLLASAMAFAQSPAPGPANYTFTLTPEATDALYGALERASQVQALVTGDRSPRYDALEASIRQSVQDQKLAAARDAQALADKSRADAAKKDEPKP